MRQRKLRINLGENKINLKSNLTCNIYAQGGTRDFKWRGWSNGAKSQDPKKSLGLPAKPKKIPIKQQQNMFVCTLFGELHSQGTAF